MRTKLLKFHFLTPCPSVLTLRDSRCYRQAASSQQLHKGQKTLRESEQCECLPGNYRMCVRVESQIFLKDKYHGQRTEGPLCSHCLLWDSQSPSCSVLHLVLLSEASTLCYHLLSASHLLFSLFRPHISGRWSFHGLSLDRMFVMEPFRCGQEFKVISLKSNVFQKCLKRTLENSLFSIFITEGNKN